VEDGQDSTVIAIETVVYSILEGIRGLRKRYRRDDIRC